MVRPTGDGSLESPFGLARVDTVVSIASGRSFFASAHRCPLKYAVPYSDPTARQVGQGSLSVPRHLGHVMRLGCRTSPHPRHVGQSPGI